jgi:hypothetical protein
MERSRNPGKSSTYLRTAINPLHRTSRGAEALGYERAGADYFFKDHTPPAMRGEARPRGLERIISSKTIKPCASADGIVRRHR